MPRKPTTQPQADSEDRLTQPGTASPPPAPDPIRVLLVDDDPNDRDVAVRHLRRAFADPVVTVVDDQAALDRALRRATFDLVITELHLGWTGGLVVLRSAKVSMPDVPVIMFTGSGNEEIAIEAMKAGLDDYVRKTGMGAIRLTGAAQGAIERAKARAVLAEAEQRATAATMDLVAERTERFVESGNDAIITADESGAITGWNSRATALFGWLRVEAIGRPLAELLVPERWRQDHLDGIANIIATDPPAGTMRHDGDLAGLHRDGHEVPVRISMSHERADGRWTFTGFARDLTAETAAREELGQELRRREHIAESLARIRPTGSVEAIAESILAEIAGSLEFELASVHTIFGRGRTASIVPLAIHDRSVSAAPIEVGRPLPKARVALVLERIRTGPAVADLTVQARSPYLDAWIAAGIRSAAYVPIGEQDDPIGVLIIGAAERDVGHLERYLPDLVEYAAISAAYLGQAFTTSRAASDTRAAIARVIRHRRFRPVFQPIFDLDRGVAIGYEALTRFDDGRPPDVVFAEAEAAGLGMELEAATLERIFSAVDGLSFGAILSVNASPELILSGRLAKRLPSWRDRLILEVTEHVVIDDYPAMRAAVEALRPVRLAVDDAGAGFASLRHIIELGPDFVKLDISLVRGIDVDLARQGLVAGMAHFATRTDRTLIAEGIETVEERDALRSLGVVLGQGFLLGRPAPLHPGRSGAS